jgi:hypothetical protein
MLTEAASLLQFESKTEHRVTGTQMERPVLLHSDWVIAQSCLRKKSVFATAVTAKLSSGCVCCQQCARQHNLLFNIVYTNLGH